MNPSAEGPLPYAEIIAIAKRWRCNVMAAVPDVTPPLLIDVVIRLSIAHRNGLTLDLPALMSAPDEDLNHDVGGIYVHIDRGTGKLGGLFQPRHVLRHE